MPHLYRLLCVHVVELCRRVLEPTTLLRIYLGPNSALWGLHGKALNLTRACVLAAYDTHKHTHTHKYVDECTWSDPNTCTSSHTTRKAMSDSQLVAAANEVKDTLSEYDATGLLVGAGAALSAASDMAPGVGAAVGAALLAVGDRCKRR